MGRQSSRAKRRTSGISYRVGEQARKSLVNFHRGDFDTLEKRAIAVGGWRTEHRGVRSGKTEDAIGAVLTIRIGRQFRSVLTIVDTQLESRWSGVKCKSAECDQQTLGSNGVCHEHAEQCSPLGHHIETEHAVKSEHVVARQRHLVLRRARAKVNLGCGQATSGGLRLASPKGFEKRPKPCLDALELFVPM
jgi:hypothetical protein